jgi:hypothetical protein
MRLDRCEEFQGGLVWQTALFVDQRIEIIPTHAETVDQLIDAREAKLIYLSVTRDAPSRTSLRTVPSSNQRPSVLPLLAGFRTS